VQWMGVAACVAGVLVALALLTRPGPMAFRVTAVGVAVILVVLAIVDGPWGPLILAAVFLMASAARSGMDAPPLPGAQAAGRE
jgi:hypothetical protein